MIPNYSAVKPQLTIERRLQIVQAPPIPRMASIVVGPQYFLSRIGQEEVPAFEFLSAGQSLPFRYVDEFGIDQDLSPDRTVDLESVRVRGVGLEALLASFNNSTAAGSRLFVEDLDSPHVLRMGTTLSHSNVSGASLSSVLAGRAVRVGDVLRITGSSATPGYTTTRRRKVIGLRGVATPGQFGTNSLRNDGNFAEVIGNPPLKVGNSLASIVKPGAWTITINSGAYVGTVGGHLVGGQFGDQFSIEVVTGGAPGVAVLRVLSASGLHDNESLATTNASGAFAFVIAGLTFHIASASDLVAAQTASFVVQAAYAPLAGMVDTSGTFTGTKATTYRIRVTTGSTGGTATGAVVEVSDTSGLEEPTSISITDGDTYQLGQNGISFSIDLETSPPAQGGLRKGDQYMLHAVPATESATEFDRIVLDGAAVDVTAYETASGSESTSLAVQLYQEFTGLIAPNAHSTGQAWLVVEGETSENQYEVEISENLALLVPERTGGPWCPFRNQTGELEVGYRALVPRAENESYVTIDSFDQIAQKLGPAVLDGELSYGVSKAFSGAQGRRVYAINTGGTDLASFDDAFARLKHTSEFAFLAVLTQNPDIKMVARAHVIEMSSPRVKRFRRAYCGIDSPGPYRYLELNPETGTSPVCQILAEGLGTARHVQHQHALVNFIDLGVEPGDILRLPVSDTQYVVQQVLSATELRLVTGPDDPILVSVPFELWKPDEVRTQKARLIQETRLFSSEQFIQIWCEGAQTLTGAGQVRIPSRFLACEIAGLRSAVPPHRPLSETEIQSVTSAHPMYTRYEPDDLDDIAANGVMVVTQEVPNGPVFIRHQLTTEVSKGNLYYEDSVGVVMDYIGLLTEDTFRPYRGKVNINRRTLAILEDRFTSMLENLTKTDLEDPDGPVLAYTRDISVTQVPNHPDRVRMRAVLGVQLPLNQIEVVYDGEVAIVA